MATARLGSAARLDRDRLVVGAFGALVAIPLLLFVAWPLWRILSLSFHTEDGVGLANYTRYFGTARAWSIVGNTFAVALTTTAITVALAYGLAYAMHRSCMPGKNLFRLILLVPLFAPSLVQAQGLLLMLGRNGLINRTFELGIDLYGFWGIVIATVLLTRYGPAPSATERTRTINRALRAAAHALGNTLAVCRKSYVHPGVIDAYHADALPPRRLARRSAGLRPAEARTLTLLRKLRRPSARATRSQAASPAAIAAPPP